jgi:DNA primase
LLPDGEDPDSFARKNNSQAFTNFIASSESDFITFKTSLLRKDAEKDPIKKASLITEIVRTISVIPESIVRSVYIRECSKILDVEEKILYTETARFRRNRFEQKTKQADVPDSFTGIDEVILKAEPPQQKYVAEKEVIRLMLLYPNEVLIESTQGEKPVTISEYFISEIERDELEFHHPVYSVIFAEMLSLIQNNLPLTEQHFIKHADEVIARTVIDLITSAYDLSKIWKRYENFFETEEMRLKEIVPEALMAFKNEKVMKLIRETEDDLRNAQQQNNEDRMQSLQIKFIVLNNLKMNLSKGLGDRIIIN